MPQRLKSVIATLKAIIKTFCQVSEESDLFVYQLQDCVCEFANMVSFILYEYKEHPVVIWLFCLSDRPYGVLYYLKGS